MNDQDMNNETDKPDNLSPQASITGSDHKPQSDKVSADADKIIPEASEIADSPDTPNQPDNSDTSIPEMKAGTGAGMSDAVMVNSVNASDGDAINNNLEALASGRMTLHVGA